MSFLSTEPTLPAQDSHCLDTARPLAVVRRYCDSQPGTHHTRQALAVKALEMAIACPYAVSGEPIVWDAGIDTRVVRK